MRGYFIMDYLRTGRPSGRFRRDFIAQIKILGDILVLWAINFVDKNAKKAQNSGVCDIFSLAYVVKYVLGRYEDFEWAIFGPR